jgi:hypothetical protein
MALQICCHSIVVQQRIIYVEQEDDAGRSNILFVHFGCHQVLRPLSPKCCPCATQNAAAENKAA